MGRKAVISPDLAALAEKLKTDNPHLFPADDEPPQPYERSGNVQPDLISLLLLREKPPLDEEYLDTGTLGAFFKLSPNYFEKLRVSGGGPPFIKIGSQVRYRFADAKRWANDRFARRSTSEVDPAAAA